MSRRDQATLSVAVTKADHIEGGEMAPVTLVEYGDYECPYCGQAYKLLKAIQHEMEHQLRFVFRNFPLTGSHPFAEMAAEAAESAAGQGRFWEMHDLLYENQGRLGQDLIIEAASTLSLDVERLIDEINVGRYKDRVHRDFMGGVRSGVNGTPSFFINGVRFEGNWESGELAAALKRLARP